MRRLHHFALQPSSRKLRILLREKDLDFELIDERPGDRREELLHLNPSGEVPVLVEPDGAAYADGQAIAEYLDETYPERPLIGATAQRRAEVRRLVSWFDLKFDREVTARLLDEKIMKRLIRSGHPDSQAIRLASANLHIHLDYIAWLADRRTWLAGDGFSLADIAAAAHLSVVDYLGDIPWDGHPGAKDWYARVKSRPSFRPLLADHVPGAPPPRHYADLDF
ncbi:MAG: glutathione S-transferase [Rhodospirillaceae bacterium]|nr:glutathione S-transferase [Rhodospirillaceae bacterium]